MTPSTTVNVVLDNFGNAANKENSEFITALFAAHKFNYVRRPNAIFIIGDLLVALNIVSPEDVNQAFIKSVGDRSPMQTKMCSVLHPRLSNFSFGRYEFFVYKAV